MKLLFSRLFCGISRQRLIGALAFFSATFLLTVLNTHSAMAATTMGEMFCTVADNMTPFFKVFYGVAYVAGAVFVIQGLMHLRMHHESPQQHPHHKTVALLTMGAFLGALPHVIGTLVQTLFLGKNFGDSITFANTLKIDAGGSFLGNCVDMMDGTVAAQGQAVPLDIMLANFVGNIQQPLTTLVSAVAVVLGVFLIIRGLMKAAKYGNDARTNSISHIVSNLIIGTALVVIGQSVDVVMASVMGAHVNGGMLAFESLQWTAVNKLGDTTHFKVAMKAALTFFQLVGFISFVRGWNIIRNAVEGVGQVTFAQGVTHIIGGVMAMNIYLFMEVVDLTMGTQFVT